MFNTKVALDIIGQVSELVSAPLSGDPPASSENLKRVYENVVRGTGRSNFEEVNETMLEIIAHRELSLTLRSFCSMMIANVITVPQEYAARFVRIVLGLIKSEEIPAIKAALAVSLSRAGDLQKALDQLNLQLKGDDLHEETKRLLMKYCERVLNLLGNFNYPIRQGVAIYAGRMGYGVTNALNISSERLLQASRNEPPLNLISAIISNLVGFPIIQVNSRGYLYDETDPSQHRRENLIRPMLKKSAPISRIAKEHPAVEFILMKPGSVVAGKKDSVPFHAVNSLSAILAHPKRIGNQHSIDNQNFRSAWLRYAK